MSNVCPIFSLRSIRVHGGPKRQGHLRVLRVERRVRLHSQGGPTMAKTEMHIYEAAEEMLRWIARAVWLPIERTRRDPYVTVSQTSI